jgi:HK97 family phage portal protein
MNRLERLVSAFAVRKSSWDQAFLKGMDLGFDDSADKEPYKRSEMVYVCISTTARAIAQVPLEVYQPTRGIQPRRWARAKAASVNWTQDNEKEFTKAVKAGEWEPVPEDHPWQVLLDQPNPLMDGFQFKQAVISYVLLDGNAWVIPYPPGLRTPAALYVVGKKSVSPKRAGNGQLDSWQYNPSGESVKAVTLKPEEVAFMRLWSPYDPILGQAPLEAGKVAARADYKAARYNEEFFNESAIPGGILTTENKLGKDQRKRLREMFGDQHKGFQKGHRLAVLEKGLKYERLALSQAEMNFTELRDKSQLTIMQCYGMKKVVIAVTEDLNYATAKEQRREWWQDTNIPLMRQAASAMNSCPAMFLNTPWIVKFNTSAVAALQEDLSAKVTTGNTLFNMGVSFKDINARLELGFDEQPWMSQGYLPMSLVPVELVGSGGGPTSGEEPKRVRQAFLPAALPAPEPETRGMPLSWEIKASAVWKGLVHGTDQMERVARSRVKRVFFEMRKTTLALVDRARDRAKDAGPDPASLYLSQEINAVNFERERALLKKAMKQTHAEALKHGIASVAMETGVDISLELTDPVAVDYLAGKALKVVRMVDTVKEGLSAQLREGMAAGESIDTIADRLRGVFNMAESRARTIARTEVVGAANFGRYAQLQETGFSEFQWFTAQDERVREDHVAMNGQVRKKDDVWTVGGSSLRYPGDYSGDPGQIINCRCIEVVVPESWTGPEGENPQGEEE